MMGVEELWNYGIGEVAKCRTGGLGNKRPVGVWLAVLAALFPLTSCFSEHVDATSVDTAAACSLTVNDLKHNSAYVPIRGFTFLVDTLRVKAGTRVTWVNCEARLADPHTSTSDARVWESPLIPIGASYSRVFNDKGDYPYHCTPHPTMRGVIIVE